MIKQLPKIVIVILIGVLIWKFFISPPKVKTVTNTVIEYKEVQVEIAGKPEIKWYPNPTKDTTGLAELNSIIDSLKQEMNENAGVNGLGTYKAEYDTTITKDSVQVAKISLYALSRIPFDPEIKFEGSILLNNKETTTTVDHYYPQTFWQRFGVSAQAGAGYGIINRQFDFYVGAGGHFQIF